jgi:hypothetical protein
LHGRLTIGLAWLFSLLIVSSPVSLSAQEPVDRSSATIRAGESPRQEQKLLQRTGWVRLEMVGGRIAVLGHRCGQSRVVQVGEPTETPREQFSVQLHDEQFVVHYEDIHAERQLTFDLDEHQQLTIRCQGASPTSDLQLVQPFRGPIRVTVGRNKPETWTIPTLWHLALQQPEFCETQLFPVLESLRPHWRLQEQADNIQQALLTRAGDDLRAERAQWSKWVQQLDSDDFQLRQLADQRLRRAGQPVVAWLQRLDRRSLSEEQASRIRDICQTLADLSCDSPPRVAAWLVDDRAAWLALLRNENADVRLQAANHLTMLFGKPLAFDPHGPASDRQQQLAQLQVRFGKP